MKAPSSNWLRGFVDEFGERFLVKYEDQLQGIETEAEAKIQSFLERMDGTQLDNLVTMIRARRGLVAVNPAYGNEIISISKQILSFGGAGIGLAAAFSHNLAELPSLLLKSMGVAVLFYVNLIALSLFIIIGFVWQSRFRYPFLYFRKIGNTIPFFYYQAISLETPRSMCQTAEEKLFAAELYASDLFEFLRHLVGDMPQTAPVSAAPSREAPAMDEAEQLKIRSQRRVVRDELQQYFLLISYQGYVNQYEVKMNNQFLYGLLASVGSALVAAVYAFGLS
jgi:hypothetical protein